MVIFETQDPDYVYLIPDGPLEKLEITEIVSATIVVAVIFWALCEWLLF